jgi:hypothetical protein
MYVSMAFPCTSFHTRLSDATTAVIAARAGDPVGDGLSIQAVNQIVP